MRKKLTSLSLLAFLGLSAIAFGQVKGTVNDVNGFASADAEVTVKGTSKVAYTDENGNFDIDAKIGDTLIIDGKEYIVSKNDLGVLKPDKSEIVDLGETVVTAFGVQKKETVVGAVGTIKAEDIENRPISNVAKVLDGTVSGVQVSTGSGQPGSGLSVQIRGVSSYSLSSTPLYVVDGAVFTGSLQDLNPNDIESLTVLKDAASTSLYGSSASNGVVMITSKKGKKGKPAFRFSSNTGVVTRAIPEYSRIGAGDYYVTAWEAMRNGYLATTANATLAQANAYASGALIKDNLKNNIYGVANDKVVVDGVLTNSPMLYNDFNWQDYIKRVGTFQKYDVDYSGASDNTSYYAGFGYSKETGYVIKSDFERYTAKANIDTQVTDWLKLGTNLSGTLVKSTLADDSGGSSYINPFWFSRAMGPIYSPFLYDAKGQRVYDSEGNPVYDGNSTRGRGASASAGRNVLQETLLNNNKQDTNAINSRFFAEFKIIQGLTFTTSLSYDVRNYSFKEYGNKVIGDASGTAALTLTTYKYTGITWDKILNYKKSIGSHNFDAILGHQSFDRTVDYGYLRKIGETVSGIYEMSNFLTPTSSLGYNYVIRKEGYFARLNYDFANKYLLSASLRIDKSSRFSDQNYQGTFWSVGAGWNIHKEAFLANSQFVNELKLRGSYGQVGNDGGIGAEPGYQVDLDLYSLGYNNGGESGVYLGQVGNPNLTWESKNSFDIGVDFSLLKRRISGSIEYYLQDISDMIFAEPVPNSAGVPGNSIYRNIGKMRNNGLELSLNIGIVRNDKFSWDLGLVAASNKNEMIKMPKGKDDAIISGTKRIAEGRSLYDFWLRQWYGVDPADGAGLFIQDPTKGSDGNSRTVNGVLMTTNHNNALYAYSGSSIPDVFGSISNTFKYGNFDLNVMLNYQLGGKTYDSNYASLMNGYAQGQSQHVDMLGAWKKAGDITNVPILSTSNYTSVGAQSSRFLVKSDYLSIKSAQIGYNFDKKLLDTVGLRNFRVYVAGENLYAWTAKKGLEPSQSFSGTTTYRYTPSRTVSLGVNVSF
ncbi:SusC/RagA family TonB-linked outer membrane protein [Empedobacter sedimenti]|uniref:SusC/RagA family TonB-linked outer membrane protein n=1 Tax=Empedobacter sedimenti TaxID=3042610 RepID=UPI0024A73BFE|nr:SusC/RagA family TonB-linked outer membrane protein [Empedobacter sedimenti]